MIGTNSNHQHIMAITLKQVRADVEQFLLTQHVLFSNESDLQLRLSCYLKHCGHYNNVEVEYYVPYTELKQNNSSLTKANFPWQSDLYIDIVVEKDGKFVPIELKYPTKGFWKPTNRFGVGVKTKVPMLKNQGAQDIVRYNYWKDVRRIEALKKAYAETIVGGLAIMVTNDLYYKNSPTVSNVSYAHFSVKDGRVVKQPQDRNMSWLNGVKVAKNHPNFHVDSTYGLHWKTMKNMADFSYLILDV